MTLNQLINSNLIFLNQPFTNKIDLFNYLAQQLVDVGIVVNKQLFLDDLLLREAEGATNLDNGLAIPHAKSDSIAHPAVVIAQLATPINHWSDESPDSPVKLVFLLAIPRVNQKNDHLRLLADLATLFIEDDLVDSLINAQTVQQLSSLLLTALQRP